MFKKKFAVLFMSFSLIFGGGLTAFHFANADDDEEEYDEDEDEDAKNETSSSSEKTVTFKETVVVVPAKIVTENQLQTISLSDLDRDGIPDEEDQHPSIAEIYIVKDDDLNGVVDTFEN